MGAVAVGEDTAGGTACGRGAAGRQPMERGGTVGYTLAAVIGAADLIHAAVDEPTGAEAVPLRQGLALVPMTDSLFDTLTDGTQARPMGFEAMPGGFDQTLAAWSAIGPVAYVEAEYFGGVGCQRAVVWEGGAVVLGPLYLDERENRPPEGSPISQALARLGAWRGHHMDEFDAVGLGQHRSTEGWAGLAD